MAGSLGEEVEKQSTSEAGDRWGGKAFAKSIMTDSG
jgi:hypothetical protein